jgi:predicted nucleotidyltransferase
MVTFWDHEMNTDIQIEREKLVPFCRAQGIRRLSVFGSALRPDFRPDSDVDVLVEFFPGNTPGLIGMGRMERELAHLFGGRRVDLRTPEDLSRYFRAEVLAEAVVQYAQE